MPKSDASFPVSTDEARLAFEFLNEIGIIHQLSCTKLERCLPRGVSYSQYSVLSHLVRTVDGKSPLTLAKTLQVTKGTMTHTLTRLEAQGLIHTVSNPRDGRSKLVYLTPKGRRLREEAVQLVAPELENLAKRFDFTSLKPFMPTIAALRETMDLYRDEL